MVYLSHCYERLTTRLIYTAALHYVILFLFMAKRACTTPHASIISVLILERSLGCQQ